MAKAKNLVIVESPAKAKTIGKYLGPDYQVKASMGHLRDLPKSTLGVDVDGDFTPNYKPIKGKEDIIKDLKTAAKGSQTVYLATDPDREGEAISWHLKYLLELPDEKARRVTFNEITKKVVTDSIQHPRDIDQDLVDAQQARRVLDRIVGYQLSPLLWKKIRRGLSAGRVQSVAMRLVAEREKEITDFVPQEYWTLDASLKNHAGALFTAHYYGKGGKKYEPSSEGDTQAIMDELRELPFTVSSVKRADKQRSPAPPFTTSTLQQEASRKLNMTPRRTMAIAQQLYEGVDITGEGTVGLITYMRTDSLRIAAEASAAARAYIAGRYGAEYQPAKTRVFPQKKSAQDAHEAIRPANPGLEPESVRRSLTADQYRLYKLIWERFIACQMSDAILDTVSADIGCGGYLFRATGQSVAFPGFLALYEEGTDEQKEGDASPLPGLQPGDAPEYRAVDPKQHFTQPPARYTEASLIKAMEEKGVGRPSTYAPTISVILDREYVAKEGRALRPTNLGEAVTDLMIDKFQDIVDVQFTSSMEAQLDEVEAGKVDYREILRKFYADFSAELQQAEIDLDKKRIKVPDEESDEVCELCGRRMVIKNGRFGKFLACPGYPECKNTKPITQDTGVPCPKCGARLLKKKSKSGYYYYGCEHNPNCDFMTWDSPTKKVCPQCGGTVFKHYTKDDKRYLCHKPGCGWSEPMATRKKTAEGEEPKKTRSRKKAEPTEAPAKTSGAAAQKPAAKKTAAKKPAAKKPAAKKTAAKKTAVKKTVEGEAPAKRTARKKKTEAAE